MNLIKKTTLALGLLAAAGVSYAQNTAATPASNGLLGQNYLEFNYDLADVDETSDYSHAITAALNIPVVPSLLDLGGTYTYDWTSDNLSAHSNTFTGYATAYVPLAGAKPFFTAELGYSWVSLPLGLGDHDAFWSVAAGVEIPFGAFTITPRITYADDFNGKIGSSDDQWVYEVEGHYWFSPKAGVFASVARVDFHRDPIDIWSYRAGLRLRF